MNVTPHMYLIVLPLVFAASVVDAIGGGGGLISLPAYLVAGLPSDLASGSNKLSASFGTLIATGKFFRSGKIMLKPALTAAALALVGAYIGAQINERMSDQTFRIVLLVLIPLIAVLMIVRRSAPDRQPDRPAGRHIRRVLRAGDRRAADTGIHLGSGHGYRNGFRQQQSGQPGFQHKRPGGSRHERKHRIPPGRPCHGAGGDRRIPGQLAGDPQRRKAYPPRHDGRYGTAADTPGRRLPVRSIPCKS